MLTAARIGLPTALMHSYYRSFWKPFFEELGLEVIETGPTTKAILNKGIRYSVPEICAPMKIYTGHVLELLDQGVDWIYIPRFVSIRKGDVFCPKFLGLPDMLKHTIPDLTSKMVTHHLNVKHENIACMKEYLEIGKLFTSNYRKIKNAVQTGRKKWLEFRKYCVLERYNCQTANGKVFTGKPALQSDLPIKIGVIGYVYNVYDDILGMDIISRLYKLGANTVTFEMLEQGEIDRQLRGYKKRLFWAFSNKLLASAHQFFRDATIDGIIHVTAFGCGPDSFLGKILEINFSQSPKPFMTVRVDEHTGESHLQTRVEAFIDMIAKSKNFKE